MDKNSSKELIIGGAVCVLVSAVCAAGVSIFGSMSFWLGAVSIITLLGGVVALIVGVANRYDTSPH